MKSNTTHNENSKIMKHIKRKFVREYQMTDDAYEFALKQLPKFPTTGYSIPKEKVAHVITTDKKFIQCFTYIINGTPIPIPEPNPVVIYFSNAQGFLSSIEEFRANLFAEIKKSKYEIGDIQNLMFGFYSVVTSFVSSLSNSIEAFVNSKIPKELVIDNPRWKKKKMNKYEILRHLSLEEKLKYPLNQVMGKNFMSRKEYAEIKKLVELRNDITHAKSDIEHDVNYYEKLYADTLDFDYISTIEAAKSLINFYEPNLIEPCNCGKKH